MRVQEVMTKNLEILPPESTVFDAAKKMKELDVGVLPIGDKERVIGVLTDRDITLGVVASDKDARDCKVQDIMSKDVETISSDSDIDEATEKMSAQQIRRLVVIDKDQRPVGIVSLGDLATKSSEARAGKALGDISEPSRPSH